MGAAQCATRIAYGRERAANAIADVVNAGLILVWGWNPAETTSAAGTMAHLLAARAAGARIIAIDPRFSDTAAKAAEWIAPRPGTDTALALATAPVIIAYGLHDRAYIRTHVHGFEQFAAHVRDWTPERAAGFTGVAAGTIRALARRCQFGNRELRRGDLVGGRHRAAVGHHLDLVAAAAHDLARGPAHLAGAIHDERLRLHIVVMSVVTGKGVVGAFACIAVPAGLREHTAADQQIRPVDQPQPHGLLAASGQAGGQ
jgi:Molybdopterin oxidoreductase